MAILFRSSNNWILSLKVVLISTGVLCTVMMLNLFVPVIMEFAFTEVPSIWSFLLSWLRPPYLYVLINFIIVSIAASSKLQQKFVDEQAPETVVPVKISEDFAAVYDGVVKSAPMVVVRPENEYGYDASVAHGSDFFFELVPVGVLVETETTRLGVNAKEEMSGVEEVAMSTSLGSPQVNSMEYSFSSYQKPPASVRIGHRKSLKSSPDGTYLPM